jgi:hypothetical protein
MPKGTSDSPITNKTEFARWLNDHPDDIQALKRRAAEYRSDPRGRRNFGQWLHGKHYKDFDRAYRNWWMRHPSKFGSVYEIEFVRQPLTAMIASRT